MGKKSPPVNTYTRLMGGEKTPPLSESEVTVLDHLLFVLLSGLPVAVLAWLQYQVSSIQHPEAPANAGAGWVVLAMAGAIAFGLGLAGLISLRD